MDDATRRVGDARIARNAAWQRVEAAGLLHRREARHQLAAAERDLAHAVAVLEDAQRAAAPHAEGRDQATQTVRQLRSRLDNRALFARLNRTEERAALLRGRLDALGTWRTWAEGKDVNPDRLSESVSALMTDGLDGRCAELVEAVHRWARLLGLDIDVSRPRSMTVGLARGEPEADVGLGLGW